MTLYTNHAKMSQQPELIETILATADGDMPLLARHLDRLQTSADALGYPCDRHATERALRTLAASLSTPGQHRLRLLLDAAGHRTLQAYPLASLPPGQTIMLALEVLDPDECLLRHKTTHRPWYDKAAAWLASHPNIFDLVYKNTRGELCEGSRSNLYLKLDGKWYTPPTSCGCLPGVQRAGLLAAGLVEERTLPAALLHEADALRLSNALRGWFDVTLI
jgi:4-amino-4-deoxychorismate lyase